MSKKVSLKLVIDNKGKRILYGEADKEFIDFLFTVLALPVGTVVKLLSTDAMVGPLSNLFLSVDALNDINYFEPNRHVHNLLKPKIYYSCSSRSRCRCYCITATDGAQCPHCHTSMTVYSTYVYGADEARPIEGGFVKGMDKYMVMDDLTVKPMSYSSMSTISVLNELNVEDIGFIQDKLVYLDINEGVKLLRASLHTPTVLTDVFLRQIDFSKHYVSNVEKELREEAEAGAEGN